MNEVFSVYEQGVIATIEQFTYDEEELRQYVIYTYYDEHEQPLYVGASRNFYNAHFHNSQSMEFFNDIIFVGFVFLGDEVNMRESKKYYIRARKPKYNRKRYDELPYLKGLDVDNDELVVTVCDMEKRWSEWLSV